MDQRRYETEFDEFEKLLGEIPKVTSGNDSYNPFPISFTSSRSSSLMKHSQFEQRAFTTETNLNFGPQETPPSYHSSNSSPCFYDSRKLDPLMFRKLQQFGYYPTSQHYLPPSQSFSRYPPEEDQCFSVNPHVMYYNNQSIDVAARECFNYRRAELFTNEDLAMSFKNLTFQPQKYNSLAEARGKIYYMAKDQNGCRFLQGIFAEKDGEDIEIIFNEIIDYISELMVDPFGNYLVQKLLEVCNEDQRMQIVHSITRKPGVLIKISCDMHGTRAVQKIVETVKRQEEISFLVSALKYGIVSLIKNVNGNHVVQRCLQHLLPHCEKFLFEAAVTHCVELATDRHGCCVLQKCLGYLEGEQKQLLVSEIASNALLLSQDPFGNYVLQYVFELQLQWAAFAILEQLEGNYTELSMQKCSSNVVEKCLKLADDKHKARIIGELINYGHLEQVMLDPYGNYVVQAALKQSKGSLHGLLVDAIRLHISSLRTNPYGKKVLSALSSKK